jgi:predicted kinase
METKQVTFLLLRGLPGSGKSTYANGLVKQGWKRLNKDMLRDMIDGGQFSPENEDSLNQLLYDMAFHYLSQGYSVVSDNMNFNVWHFLVARKVANRVSSIAIDFDGIHCEVKGMDFHTPIEECIRRDALRPKPVTEEVIRKIEAQWGLEDGNFPDVSEYIG